ncbi:uncharacterized protein C3orf26 homolog [Patella vulgata]|uniref:uncharacterized protein C3orf26 homolog n=1 Tax=Patella vulgata TaxID=6465 RepID=UPI00217F98D6|nr:uncharacterized protein C3orf26 homolog [Patella vulgata]
MADDLEDGFYIQENIVAESGESDDPDGEQNSKEINEEKPVKISSKRPRETEVINEDDAPIKKKKKRKRKRITEELAKKKPVNAKKGELIEFIHNNFDGKLSSIEWDDLKLDTESDLFPANEKEKKASDYLQELFPKWTKLLQITSKPGSPLIIVLTASAIRAVDLNRELNEFKTKKCKTAKLFGKHLKASEQQQYLSKHVCHIAVGTPLRVLNLVKSGSLKLNKLEGIVLDWNKRDVKSKRMIDIPEVKQALLDLFKGGLVSAVHKSRCKFALL